MTTWKNEWQPKKSNIFVIAQINVYIKQEYQHNIRVCKTESDKFCKDCTTMGYGYS